MGDEITYEHPIAATFQTFLAFERAAQAFASLTIDEDPWRLRCAVQILVEIERLTARGRLRCKLRQELRRQIEALEKLGGSRDIDHALLGNIIVEQSRMLEALDENQAEMNPGRQRNALMDAARKGVRWHGLSSCDAGVIRYWLHRPQSAIALLNARMQTCLRLGGAIDMVLSLMRDSAIGQNELAVQGLFQGRCEYGKPCQLLRVTLPATSACYPVMKSIRNRFTLRFMQPSDDYAHAPQVEDDVEFRLARCGI